MREAIFFGGRRVGVGTLGTLERRNPLPAGRYWIDLFAQDSDAWLDWRKRNASSVGIEATEHINSEPPRDFIIFHVTAPVSWEGPGYPNVADKSVQSSNDTAQRPPPQKDPIDKIPDLPDFTKSSSGMGLLSGLAIVGGGLFAVYLISRAIPKPRPARV